MADIRNVTNVVAGQHITAVPPSLGAQGEVSLHESKVRGRPNIESKPPR